MSTEVILLLSHSAEPFNTERVEAALRSAGAEVLRLNTDRFPTEQPLSAALSSSLPGTSADTVLLGEAPLRVRAVWYWRLWPPRLDPSLSPAFREAAERESRFALRSILELLSDVPWLNSPSVVDAAANKVRQLRLARSLGLTIPPTLVTSDAAQARRFFDAHGGDIITKLHTGLTYGMTPTGPSMPTRKVRREDLAAMDGLKHCPMIFQRYIPKKYELRVAWVAGRAFVGALDGAKCGVDWRYEGAAEWQPYALPDDVQSAISQLMSALGLRQGALDFIVTPEGDHIFLEVNPQGEWGMLELHLGLPISSAIADALLSLCGGGARATA